MEAAEATEAVDAVDAVDSFEMEREGRDETGNAEARRVA